MNKLKYTVELEGGARFTGEAELSGRLHIALELPTGTLRSVRAEMPLKLAEGEKIFMNGYQTWTYCPEYDARGFTRGLGKLPKFIRDYYGTDRYGDYNFVPYPLTPGVTHGESYCYFRAGESYRLVASLDERPGYTLLRYDSRLEMLTLERDCSGVACGGVFHAFDLFFAAGSEAQVFDAWFDALGVRPRTSERLAGYTSWYRLYQNIDESSIYADLDGAAAVLTPGDLFQIDDGWEPAVGDWLSWDEKKFPRGMKVLAEDIHAKGFKAGLWLAPFVCQKSSSLMREHPDWLLRHDGKPWYCGCNWGGFYSLDVDKPQVLDYLRRVFSRVLDDWGFDLVKLDFLYGAAPFGTARESRGGRMTRCMELLRELCGDKLMLGCGVPLMPCFGLADYCRISCDVGPAWKNKPLVRTANREVVSTRQAIGNSLFRRQLNGRAFLSDPDVFYLREDGLKLTPEQKHVLATVNSLLGGMLLCSDNMGLYDRRALAQYAQLLKNRDAEDLRVHAGGGLSLSYTLDGEEKTLTIE